MRPVIVCHYPVRRAVEVVELPGPHRPYERCTNQEREHDGERDQQEQDVHDQGLARRSALATTTSDDTAIPTDASNGVTRPAAASGIATTL